ncbi:16S rRNA (guanine(966)-N(2))-methyltransferase RsmD [Thermanaerothrix sp. 4228-RoL]|uniref:16S rRNA (Guanine(966)-N(2))-methyltransferase RsmD n=1 Tax=Thermanaerothrix solaris TaxID=3058434 RepID=A0ABU3NLK5_9CHLR|nr:16S rRNA (guanine(966)-N(2))-methyltransferase RsmD [Thermanaerothrix sp. 4228-RoL]MDT8897235.1 16S rRNA (guanine(966)-N(2))-methyltransferase RsmD [Thermanaerothrix sp. 4228-RoL]
MTPPRIIGGKSGGIRLRSVPGSGTRPITDRVKEALFNILGPEIEGSTFLDLFAGTGSVGLEALSRGASYVCFIDASRQAISTIKENLRLTHLEQGAEILHMDAFAFLRHPPTRTFDFIFVAPPQYKGLWEKALAVLDANPTWLSPTGTIIVQIDPNEYKPLLLQHFAEEDRRRYGSTQLIFYRCKPSQEAIATSK